MKFLSGNGKQLSEKLRIFPWSNVFLPSNTLVVGVVNDSIIATCGIRSMFSILTLYVREEYRGQGIGKQILEKTLSAAQKQGLNFVSLVVSRDNIPALHLYYKLGFKEITYFEKRSLIMMLPFGFKGKFVYILVRMMCVALPDGFLANIAKWVHERTLQREIK